MECMIQPASARRSNFSRRICGAYRTPCPDMATQPSTLTRMSWNRRVASWRPYLAAHCNTNDVLIVGGVGCNVRLQVCRPGDTNTGHLLHESTLPAFHKMLGGRPQC
jgi:hypothetical protein